MNWCTQTQQRIASIRQVLLIRSLKLRAVFSRPINIPTVVTDCMDPRIVYIRELRQQCYAARKPADGSSFRRLSTFRRQKSHANKCCKRRKNLLCCHFESFLPRPHPSTLKNTQNVLKTSPRPHNIIARLPESRHTLRISPRPTISPRPHKILPQSQPLTLQHVDLILIETPGNVGS